MTDLVKTLPEPYAALSQRIATAMLEKRLIRQGTHWALRSHQGSGIFRPINELAHLLGRRTVGEFVESEQTSRWLRELGVEYGHRPLF
jgi:EAL domain-containing protein (putative c-di-GMP-specific phosphodiesterase class I)